MKAIKGSHIQFLFIVLVTCFAAAFNIHCGAREQNTEPQYASLDTSTKYVGMQTCRECHSDIYNSYIQTGMGKSFDHASISKSSGVYDQHAVVYDKHKDFYYRPYFENDSLRIMEYRIESGDTIHKRIETVDYIVGSGQHTNSHIMNTGGFLNQMPLTFYTQKGQWDLPPGFENGNNTRFSRLIGLECMTCHNSYPEFETGSENKYSLVQNGISCERCHGPGEKHVNDKKMSRLVDITKEIDYSIVNPAKLPIALQLDVCQRCHIQGNAVLNEGKSFTDFRPGMPLSEIMNVYMPVYKGREHEHIMASHVERLKMSECFIVSTSRAEKNKGNDLMPYKNSLTCVTCHDPHVSVINTNQDHFNVTCKNCHAPGKDMMCTEKPEALHLAGNNCVSCHMPKSGTTDIPHVSVHDHYIRIPVSETESGKIREFVGINCINNPNAPREATGKAFIAYFEKFNFGEEVLDSAKKYFPSSTAEDVVKNIRPLIQIAFLEKNYALVTNYISRLKDPLSNFNKKSTDNNDAWTMYRVGESYLQQGNNSEATRYYRRAYELAPSYPEFANKYATSLAADGNASGAYEILVKSVSEYPKFPPALSNLGYLTLVVKQDTIKASQLYNQAIALDPDYDQAMLNKAGLLIFQGKNGEAKKLVTKFLKRHPANIKVQQLSAQLNSI